MMTKYLFGIWTALAPVVANHLWQSTLFVIPAGLLILVLSKNHAQYRDWLWLTAPIKFLIPFFLLVSLGGHFPRPLNSPEKAGMDIAVGQVTQPFGQPTVWMGSRVGLFTAPHEAKDWPTSPLLLWLCGFLVVLLMWYSLWWVSKAMRETVTLCEGRQVEALRCQERIGGIRKRIEVLVSIVSENLPRRLSFNNKLVVLCAAGFVSFALPIAYGIATVGQTSTDSSSGNTISNGPRFEVASIKLTKTGGETVAMLNQANRFFGKNVTAEMLIQYAYRVKENQILGAPNWSKSEKYDVEAKVEKSELDKLQKLSPEERERERQEMVKNLLADRFNLVLHRDTKTLPVYVLVIGKNGPKLRESQPGDTYSNGIQGPDGRPAGAGMLVVRAGQITAQAVSISRLAEILSRQLGRTVIDKTGLTGKYDFTLELPQDDGHAPMLRGDQSDSTLPTETSGPSVFTTIQDQLGLKLESEKGPGEILVIDHVQKPSEN